MISNGPAFEDVNVGDEIPRLVVGPVTLQDLVEWCGAEEDYLNIHYDEAAALAAALPGCFIQGCFKCRMLGQMLTDWLAEDRSLKKMGGSYREMGFPGDTLTCHGKVTNKYVEEGESSCYPAFEVFDLGCQIKAR